jgi:nicotinamidase/pyrazinamidase
MIDEIYVTLDTHHPDHIAHKHLWQDANGNEPPDFTSIRYSDILNGVWIPKDSSMLVISWI